MPNRVWSFGAPNCALALLYIVHKPGCTVAAVKRYLGIEPRLGSILDNFPIGKADHGRKTSVLYIIESMIRSGSIRSDRPFGFLRLLGSIFHEPLCNNEEQLELRGPGIAALADFNREILGILAFIHEKDGCQGQELRAYLRDLAGERITGRKDRRSILMRLDATWVRTFIAGDLQRIGLIALCGGKDVFEKGSTVFLTDSGERLLSVEGNILNCLFPTDPESVSRPSEYVQCTNCSLIVDLNKGHSVCPECQTALPTRSNV